MERMTSLACQVGFLLLLALLAGMLTNLASSYHPRFIYLPGSMDSQQAILERRPFVFDDVAEDFPSWRSRILVPHAIELIHSTTGLKFSQCYLLVRYFSAWCAIGTFGWLAARRLGGGIWTAGLGAMLLTLALLPTFMHIYDIPSDFPDAAFFALLVWSALEKRRGWFVGLLFLALLNRESALFALPIWMVLHGLPLVRKSTLTEAAYCGVLGIGGIALTLWLRAKYALAWSEPVQHGGDPILTQPLTIAAVSLQQLQDFLARPVWSNSLFFLFGYLAFYGVVAAAGWHQLAPSLRRLAWMTVAIFAASVPIANLPEMRVYIPAIVLGTFILLAVLIGHLRPDGAA